MPEEVRKAKKGKTIYFQVSAWYNEQDGKIHINGPWEGHFTTVSSKPESDRYHSHLYNKLAQLLRENDVPAPDTDGL